MSNREISLKVADARQRDIGHGKVRIDNDTMQKLGLTAGNFVEIHGKKMTVAIAWPAYAEDQGQEIMRMDGSEKMRVSPQMSTSPFGRQM
jgi:transitional endoplasmic reticulum ATPase